MTQSVIENDPEIHPTAIVSPEARLGEGVRVGAYSLIGPHVTLGAGTIVYNSVTVTGHVTCGRNNEFHPYAVVGARPQDLKYRGEKTFVTLGDNNIVREQVTIHAGTTGGGGVTSIGHGNLLMVGAHVGHDVTLGSHCVVGNLCLLGGHAVVEDYANIGGDVGIHHFTTLGKHCMIAGTTRVTSDVPPFLTIASTRTTRQEVRMVNGVGLKRRGFSESQIRILKNAYMRLFSRRARSSGVPIIRTIHALKAECDDENVQYLCDFLLRSFECGRRGRYLESLRSAPTVAQAPDARKEAQP